MIKCQICQHENPDGAEYCEDCGASLAMTTALHSGAGEGGGTASGATESTPSPQGAATNAAETTPPQAAGSTATDTTTAPSDSPAPSSPEPLPAFEPVEDTPAAAPAAPTTATETVPAAPAPAPASAPAGGQQPRLVGQRYGADSGEVYPLLGDSLVVGRFDPESGPVDIDLSQAPEAENISRHHAQVYREGDGRWYVKDLGAMNGVFIKSAGSAAFGPRLTTPQALQNGDEVAFGNARFIFRTD